MAWAMQTQIGDPLAKLLLLALADRADKETGQCWPSLARLSADTEISPATIARKLNYLEDSGFIKRDRRDKTSTVYTLSQRETPTLSQTETGVSHSETGGYLTVRHEPISNNLSSNLDNILEENFGSFWTKYPKKAGKGQARKAFKAALKKATFDELMAALDPFIASQANTEQQYIPHASTWLNGERWLDEDVNNSGWGDLNEL